MLEPRIFGYFRHPRRVRSFPPRSADRLPLVSAYLKRLQAELEIAENAHEVADQILGGRFHVSAGTESRVSRANSFDEGTHSGRGFVAKGLEQRVEVALESFVGFFRRWAGFRHSLFRSEASWSLPHTRWQCEGIPPAPAHKNPFPARSPCPAGPVALTLVIDS